MRILHHERLPQGAQISIERLFSAIRKALPPGLNVVLCQSPEPSRGLFPRLRNLCHARRLRGDVHHIVGDVHYLAFALPGRQTVLTIHDCAALERLRGWKRFLLRLLWFSGPMKRVAVLTTISATTRDELRRHLGKLADRARVIPNCVRPEFLFHPRDFNSVSPLCLQVGTGWNKNVERGARALAGTPCRLEIVGELSERQRDELLDLGVPFRELGPLNDEELVEAYRRCDLLIFASLYEGFGLPILEAQATGRPVVTSHCSSMPEAAGEGALLVDPESVESIHAAVTRLISEPETRKTLIENGLRNVAKYQPEVIAAQYAGIYSEVYADTKKI